MNSFTISENLAIDPSFKAELEKAAVNGDERLILGVIQYQSNILQGNADFESNCYAACDGDEDTKKRDSFFRDQAILYINELMALCEAEEIEIPLPIKLKAKFALLRGHIGRMEEIQFAKQFGLDYSHIHPEIPLEFKDPDLLLELSGTQIYRMGQDLGIADHTC